MNAIGAGLDRGDRVDDAEAAVAVPMPVDLHRGIQPVTQGHDEADQVARSPRRGVAHGVTDADTLRTRVDGRRVELLHVFRLGPRGVFRDVHDGDAVVGGELDGMRRLGDHPVDVPLLGELADGRGADEEVGLDGDANSLGDIDDRADVVLMCTAGSARVDGELVVDDLTGQPLHGSDHVRAGAGKADVGVIDARGMHEMKNADLLVDRRIGDGRRLQAIAQRLVIEFDLARRRSRRPLAGQVPVVNQVLQGVLHIP